MSTAKVVIITLLVVVALNAAWYGYLRSQGRTIEIVDAG